MSEIDFKDQLTNIQAARDQQFPQQLPPLSNPYAPAQAPPTNTYNYAQANPTIIVNQNVSMQDRLPDLMATKNQPKNAIESLADGSLDSRARLNFIKKVYLILLAQLSVTIGVCFISYNVEGFFRFQIEYWWITLIFSGLVLIFCLLIQCTSLGRQSPCNLVILFLFTLSFSYIISYITSLYASIYGGPLVIEACIITMSMVIALTLYAVFTKTDFTTMIGIIIVVLVCFSVFGIMCIFQKDPVLYKLYCAFGAILAGIMLIIDTQMIVGGEKNIEISMDDYVLGALILYVDVIRLFLYILRAMGAGKRR